MPGISGGVDCNISIHAPTQGATHKTTLTQNFCFISIHAPTQGATIGRVIITSRLYISIHAPTQGATAKLHRFHTRKFYFTSKFYTIRLKITILSGQIIFFLVSLSNFPLLSGANLPGNLCSLHIRTWPYPEFTRRLSHPDITLHYFLFYFIINNERFPDIFLSSSSSHSNLPIPSIIRFVFHSFKIPIESNTQTTKAHTDTDINAR